MHASGKAICSAYAWQLDAAGASLRLGIVAYKTNPDTDLTSCDRQAADILARLLAATAPAKTVTVRLPMAIPPENAATDHGPWRPLMRAAARNETDPEVLSARLFAVQSWLHVAIYVRAVAVSAVLGADAKGRPHLMSGESRSARDARRAMGEAAFSGVTADLGTIAVFRAGEAPVLLTSQRGCTRAPQLFRCEGLRSETARMVVFKSRLMYRAAYQSPVQRMLTVRGTGSSPSDFRGLPYPKVGGHVFPFNRNVEVYPPAIASEALGPAMPAVMGVRGTVRSS